MTERMNMTVEKRDTNTKWNIEKVDGPSGGKGSISAEKFEIEQPEYAKALFEIINSGECLVKITHEDDGCIDGRCVCDIAYADNGELKNVSVVDNSGHERAKVSGGGYITVLAMLQALGDLGNSPEEDIEYIGRELAKQKIYCGGHTGSHGKVEDGVTDCGANDKQGIIINAGNDNHELVVGLTSALINGTSGDFDDSSLEHGLDNWKSVSENGEYSSNSNGVTRLDAIHSAILTAEQDNTSSKKAAVIKSLTDNHNEKVVVVVDEPGFVFSQTKLRQLMQEKFPDADPKDFPQVFALEQWRVRQLAAAVSKFANRDGSYKDNVHSVQTTALHGGSAFQTATYLTLTDGSLPFYFVKAA